MKRETFKRYGEGQDGKGKEDVRFVGKEEHRLIRSRWQREGRRPIRWQGRAQVNHVQAVWGKEEVPRFGWHIYETGTGSQVVRTQTNKTTSIEGKYRINIRSGTQTGEVQDTTAAGSRIGNWE
jgi:hypothetical protein